MTKKRYRELGRLGGRPRKYVQEPEPEVEIEPAVVPEVEIEPEVQIERAMIESGEEIVDGKEILDDKIEGNDSGPYFIHFNQYFKIEGKCI